MKQNFIKYRHSKVRRLTVDVIPHVNVLVDRDSPEPASDGAEPAAADITKSPESAVEVVDLILEDSFADANRHDPDVNAEHVQEGEPVNGELPCKDAVQSDGPDVDDASKPTDQDTVTPKAADSPITPLNPPSEEEIVARILAEAASANLPSVQRRKKRHG